jgi:hypothetical protein
MTSALASWVVAQIASKAALASKTLFIKAPLLEGVDGFLLPIHPSETGESPLRYRRVAMLIFWIQPGCNDHFLDSAGAGRLCEYEVDPDHGPTVFGMVMGTTETQRRRVSAIG